MKTKHNQVMVEHDPAYPDHIYGTARCPYCGTVNSLKKLSTYGYLVADHACKHANMAVSAGDYKIAIHFIEMA